MATPFLDVCPTAGLFFSLARPLVVRDAPADAAGSDALDALVRCARAGDPDAFHRVTEQLTPELVAFVRRRLAIDRDTARDVVQDTFVLAWCNLDHIRDDNHLRPWLFRVAQYRAVSWIRRRGPGGRAMASIDRRHELGFETPDDAPRDRRRSSANADGDSVVLTALRRAIDRLTPNYRGVVRLHYQRGFDIRETARLLGLTRASVKMRLFRARRVLRRLMLAQLSELPAPDAKVLETWIRERIGTRRTRPGGSALRAILMALALTATTTLSADEKRAEQRITEAKTYASRHWSLATTALGDAARSARPRSSSSVRAFRAMATTWKGADRPYAALAAYAAAAARAFSGDAARFSPRLAAARLLDAEGDVVGARLVLASVAGESGSASPSHTERALVHLVALAFEAGDADAVRALARRLERARASPAAQIVAWGRVGQLALRAGDRKRATSALRRASAAYADAVDDPKAVRAWLDLPLRHDLGK